MPSSSIQWHARWLDGPGPRVEVTVTVTEDDGPIDASRVYEAICATAVAFAGIAYCPVGAAGAGRTA